MLSVIAMNELILEGLGYFLIKTSGLYLIESAYKAVEVCEVLL